MAFCWSNMRQPPSPCGAQHLVDGPPLLALHVERTAPLVEQAIVFALAAALRVALVAANQALLLGAVQNGVEHAVGPFEPLLRELAHALDDGVTVAVAARQDRQDQGRGRRRDQLFGDAHAGRIPFMPMYIAIL